MITTSLDRTGEAYDVVVIGSGAAGLVSALRAADSGLQVLVLEKAEKLGGTTAVGGGVVWSPCNHLMGGAGFTDTEAEARAYIRAAAGHRMSAMEIDWYVRTSSQAVRFLDECTRVALTPLSRPDYHMDFSGAAEGGRGLDNDAFDPACFEGLADSIRASTYFPLITMNERDSLKGRSVDPQLLAARAAAGVRTMGGALAGSLVASALDRGIEISNNAQVTSMDRLDHGGWQLTAGSQERRITAENVVLASGGFEWNKQLREALLKYPITPISAPSNEGDGLRMGLAAGADMDEMTAVWGVPVIAAPSATYDGLQSGRMGNVEMTLPGSITVNSKGRRFVNEAMNYHDLSRVFANIDPISFKQENNPAWLIFDERYQNLYSVAGSTPGTPEPWMASAGTPEELATVIGVDRQGLIETLQRFNAGAVAGHDPEFGRGSTEQERHLGDPTNLPNPCLAPLDRGPFYAVPIHAGVLGTAGGLKTDLEGRVLSRTGAVIAGLFAAGNCSATVFRDAYPGGGATLGSAITRAFAIGNHLSEYVTAVSSKETFA